MAQAGAPAAPEAKKDLISVAFWGICDIKYDPSLPECDRVRVLEFGDGRTSRFSHHGRAIKEKFESGYCMDPQPIKRAVMTENKKFTHDMFVQEGFSRLRPPTVSCDRRYTPVLAQEVLTGLGIARGGRDAVVLKLCNRSRGAGIVVTDAEQLDSVLKRLLSPPEGAELERFFREHEAAALNPTFADVMEEQCLHWWSNECPLFVAERCCHSVPVQMHPESPQRYDGTMRVAFALYRKKQNDYRRSTNIGEFSIDWLGGYWKLPRAALQESTSQSLEDLHGRVVSSFNSAEKRTAPVPPEHLQEVYDALTPALPRIFGSGVLGVQMIMSIYRGESLFCAFALSRAAAAMRTTDLQKALGLFDLARKMVTKPSKSNAESLPAMSVLSYIDRNVGVCSVLVDNWREAGNKFMASVQTLPVNSTAYYLQACYFQEDRNYKKAIDSMLKSIMLDPDFRSPYIGLGNCYLLSGQFDEAIETSLACLMRHNDTPGAEFNLGQATYHILQQGLRTARKDTDTASMVERAVSALGLAKARMPEQWNEVDENMLTFLRSDRNEQKALPKQPVHVWKVYGYRP